MALVHNPFHCLLACLCFTSVGTSRNVKISESKVVLFAICWAAVRVTVWTMRLGFPFLVAGQHLVPALYHLGGILIEPIFYRLAWR